MSCHSLTVPGSRKADVARLMCQRLGRTLHPPTSGGCAPTPGVGHGDQVMLIIL